MKIQLSQKETMELHSLAGDIRSTHGRRKAIETLDSSKMAIECQITHRIMQLYQSMSDNQYQEKIHELAKKTYEELGWIKEFYEIADEFIPVLALEVEEEVKQYTLKIEAYSDPTFDGGRYADKETMKVYTNNLSKTLETLQSILKKIGEK